MTEEHKSTAVQPALIGLLGTILAVCGGICSALITSSVTIYQVERQNQQLVMPASGNEETLNVDTGTIFVTRQKAAALDPKQYYVNLERAFILHRPLSGWNDLQEMTMEEQLAEDNVPCQAFCDQPVYQLRYGEPMEIEADQWTTINGRSLQPEMLNLLETLYGTPPWKLPYYSQMILNIFDKGVVQGLGINNLPDMILLMTSYTPGRVNKVIAQDESHFAVVQSSSTYAGIHVNGETATLKTEKWVLFAEADNAFYIVEIRYAPMSGQPLQVWDDLQIYIDQFRVIQ
jgi:hypothetical protein